jgi:flagellar motor protein MotB
MIVSRAREAAQMAEDARIVTVKRRDEDRLSRERQEDREESRARTRAEAEAQQAQDQAAADRAAANEDRAAAERERAEAERARAIAERSRPEPPPQARERQTRANLLAGLNNILPTRDTPRGLVVVVPSSMLETSPQNPSPPVARQLAQIASLITTYPGLSVRVEGYTDDRNTDLEDRAISQGRAQVVRDILITNGVPSRAATAVGYGKDRPVASNDSASGRDQNRRVEIVIQGPALSSQLSR